MTDWLQAAFWAPLTETYFQKALIGGGLVAIVSGVIGCLVVLRRMAFLGDALSHAMIAGVAGGYLFMKLFFGVEAFAPAMLVGSLLAAVLTVGLISVVSRVSRVKEDTAIGIMYTGVFAGGVVFVTIFRNYIHIDLMHFIMGDILAVADTDLWASAITAAVVLSAMVLFFRHFQITSFDPVMAAAIGLPVIAIDYALTVLVSLVVVSAVSMVGVILVVGLLITPAASAYLLSDRLSRMMALAALFGLTSVIGGLYMAVWLDSAGGGAVMVFCTLQFLVVLVAAPKYGMLARWLRLRRMVPQDLTEDLLLTLLREGGEPVMIERLQLPTGDGRLVQKAVRSLTAQGLVWEEDGVRLSESGLTEANRVMRAHRLWEAYLAHVGTPAGDIHPKAHELEHIKDQTAYEYLDDLLGHPIQDPHGREIPPDPNIRPGGEPVPLSLLREGREAEVVQAPDRETNTGLQPGDRVCLAARRHEGRTWVAVKDGREIELTHHQADAILVTPLEADGPAGKPK